jgi:hypothetical protein
MFLVIDQMMSGWVDVIVEVGGYVHKPLLLVAFIAAIVLRGLVYYTVKRQDWFVSEFRKRALRGFENQEGSGITSFFGYTKALLERTYYELFAVRGVQMRRRVDFVMTPGDRLFLIQPGCAYMVKDLQRHMRSLKAERAGSDFTPVARASIETNPCFSKLFGIVPLGALNEFLNILPGLFIIGGGIFGTFLGIMKAMPELGNLNPADIEGTKVAMESFISKVGFAMSASILGIACSVCITVINSAWNPDRVFVGTIDKLASTLALLWNASEHNQVPVGVKNFDANRDPLEALAEAAVEKELQKHSKVFDHENTRTESGSAQSSTNSQQENKDKTKAA